jgi:putative intracellular protease/amidase
MTKKSASYCLLCQTSTHAQETPRKLGVLLFPGFEMLDACGPMEIWRNLDSKVKLITVTKSAGPVITPQGVDGKRREGEERRR